VRRSLSASIRERQQQGLLPVLSEIKIHSPKDGDLLRGREPEALARAMGARGIAGLSVVTEPKDFGGSLDLVRRVRPLVDVPILRKDFVTDERGLEETLAAGADAILLTVLVLGIERLARLHAAARERGLETLVETHDRGEIGQVVESGLRPDLLGINNRNILLLEKDDGDVSRTESLAALAPAGSLVLSESSIRGPDDARRARDAGADAVLVGTAILLAPDLGQAIDALVAVGWPPQRT
jgi:indole-3-glycerol phosphate synthase